MNPLAHDLQVGTFVKTCAPQIIEILGRSGLDFAVLDAEHAPFDRMALDLALMAGLAVRWPLYVRVSDQQPATLLNVLDLGAAGVLVPHVDSAQQATDVVARTRYLGGERGYSGSPRSSGYGAVRMRDALAAGARSFVMCQIESGAGVDACAQIAAVDGVDGVFIGRADLALSMGLDDSQHPQVLQATQHVIRAGLDAGKRVGMFVGSLAERSQYVAQGVSWFVHGSDQALLRQGAQAVARTASSA
ncbi:MAG: aldolase [Hydrogenophaga sp.]|nr:aldolase [Hydrogenophaga sp.]